MIDAISRGATDLAHQLWRDGADRLTIQDLAEDYCADKLGLLGFDPRLYDVRTTWGGAFTQSIRIEITAKDAVTLLGEVE